MFCRCSVTKSCSTLCDPVNCSMPGFPVLHYLPEFSQAHVHWVDDVSNHLILCCLLLLLPSMFPSIKVFYESALHIRWLKYWSFTFSPSSESVQFSQSVVSDSLQPHGLQHTRLPCPSPNPGFYSSSCPLSQWCHPTISSSVIPSSSRIQSFPASGSFQMSQFFSSGGQNIGVSASASVLPVNIQG